MMSHRSQGPLRGQHYRQANLTQMGIKIIDQKSESIYVDSEVSIKKRKQKNPLEINRGLYKSQTYKEIYKQDSLKENDKFDSPLDQSVNQPLYVTNKFSNSLRKYNVQGLTKIFIQKLLYNLRISQKQQNLTKKFQKFLEDKASDTINEESEDKEPLNCNLFLKDSYERTLLDLCLILILISFTILVPIFNERFELLIIFVFLYSIFKVIDYKTCSFIDLPIISINILAFYQTHFVFANIINVIKVYQLLKSINILTEKKLIRFLFSILIIIIHVNNSAQFWKYILDEDLEYKYLLCDQITLLFNFDFQIYDQNYKIYNSVNRILSFLVLLYFSQQFINFIKLPCDLKKKEELFEQLLRKNTMSKQPFRIQHQVRQLLWSKVQNYKQVDSHPSQLELNFPNELRRSLNLHSYLDIIQKSTFIKQQFSTQFQSSLSEFVKEQTVESGEIIQQENSSVSKLIFLLEGELSIKINNRRVQILKKFSIVNQYEFFACQLSPCNIVAKSRCKIIVIDYQQFYDLVCMHNQDFQIYRMWYDRMIHYNQRCVYKVCYICMDQHETCMCPAVFYQPNYNKIVSNSTYTIPNLRLKYHRFEKKRVSSLTQQNLISITAVNWAQQFNIISKNTDMVDQFLGKQDREEEYQLFADEDHTSKYLTQTYTHQQSIKSPKTNKTGITGRERDRVHTDSNINRTLTIRTLKASENGTSRLKPNNNVNSNNDSIVVSNSPSPLQQPNKTPLMLFTKEQMKRQSNISSSFTIDRGQDKKSSLQSQQQPVHSTSILQSKEVVQQLQSNLGSPNMLNTQTKLNGNDFSINWHRSDTQPIFSDLIGSVGQLILIRDFENMQYYEWYFPKHNYIIVIERFRKYLSKKFNSR
ncbi:unnamed protein product (macronuclear) [Paramecium tetraurelia]|uniref:Cyclic nucleotide-binding domain-containing protein n=1 Tax=Paramecium tetraurelia TaxID=5888 RepID=A0BJ99_PARTE|nr:uncharacterized protein GSPATT00004989001 [Paramecium tetraurelia]CAK58616.1 unnamed protein product [Paramecium tetraurelia]|eukprot:XP_001426014.1 hypothetical protein (macronuclear) [Paramecium tetraurelia strain d4-2]